MITPQYGEYDYIPDGLIPEAHVALTLYPAELTAHWRRCGVISDFIGAYVAGAFPTGAKLRESTVYNSVTTIFQELIENAAKFSLQRDGCINVELRHFDRLVAFEVRNVATDSHAQEFETHIKTLLSATDLDAMYLEIIEKRHKEERKSGIGLLLLMKDYGLKVGVRFLPLAPGKTSISVKVFYFLEDD